MSNTFSPGLPNPKPIPCPSKDFGLPDNDPRDYKYHEYCKSLHPSIRQLKYRFFLVDDNGWTMLIGLGGFVIDVGVYTPPRGKQKRTQRFSFGPSARVAVKIDADSGRIYFRKGNGKSIMEFNIGDVNIDGFIL